ncbi:tail completion protein gp17 [Pumilibacter intestinalis]|uniref:tail completion protein gp17 n=1 Tax=Pumilibacter intestinalis TaxID=2941511 RepID=UPI003B84A1DC
MKDICQAVYEKLCSDLNISRYVCGRIYPIVLPEDAPLPAIVYTPVLANYDSALQGDTGFVRQTMQLVCHDTTYKKARELSRKVKCVFQDYSGDMCGLNIQAVFIKSDYEYNGNTALKFDTNEYMSSIEFEFHFNEK